MTEKMLREEVPELETIEDAHPRCPALVKVVVEKFLEMLKKKDEEIVSLVKVLDEAVDMTSSEGDCVGPSTQ